MNADKKAVLQVKARGGYGWGIGLLLGMSISMIDSSASNHPALSHSASRFRFTQ